MRVSVVGVGKCGAFKDLAVPYTPLDTAYDYLVDTLLRIAAV